jgi:hypothetical protein
MNQLNFKVMENLNQNGIQELSAAELQNTEGGFFWQVLTAAAIGLVITEWESAKKAAVDLWNFEYDSPE